MKRRIGTLVRDIEQNQVRIAALRNDKVRIDTEIEALTMANKTHVMTLVGNAVERLDFGSIAIDDLLSLISKMTETVGNHNASEPTSIDVGTIQTFVRLSRNASVSNRRALDAAGLRWNGRSGGWTGLVSSAQFAELRRVFGERVEKHGESGEGHDPGSTLDRAVVAVSADVGAIATLADEEPGKAAAAEAPSPPDAPLIPRSPFSGFPMRRSAT
jgi:hypothetical protein